jgi:hypothetical protein
LAKTQVSSVDPTTQFLLSQIGHLNPQQVQQLLTMVAAQISGGALQQASVRQASAMVAIKGVCGNYGYQGGR